MTPPNNYWFKRRRYGYGWVPSTPQGGAVLVVYILLLAAGMVVLPKPPKHTFSHQLAYFLLYIFGLTAVLIAVTLAKGPRPKWRWGSKPGDNPDEDY